MNQRANLSAADGACTARAEDDLLICKYYVRGCPAGITFLIYGSDSVLKMPSFQVSLTYSDFDRVMVALCCVAYMYAGGQGTQW